MPDGTYWIITDNGFGSKANSPDAMLYLNRYRIDWAAGTFNRLETIFLYDPDKKVPFRIVHDGTEKRYLTSSDFDIEGFQWIGETLWIGDEFGPYIIKADKSGKVLGIFESVADGKPVRSPDHFVSVLHDRERGVVDASHIVVGNDNNLPFSSSREPNKADDNEFVLLEVAEFLKAK
jgi:hypothetical protein